MLSYNHPTQPLSPLPQSPRKPRLVDLINTHHFSMIRLAKSAGVQLSTVHAMVRGCEVSQAKAMQVLKGLEWLTGRSYALADLDIPIQQSIPTRADCPNPAHCQDFRCTGACVNPFLLPKENQRGQ